MRGRTLADSFIILDEAQNTTPAQMKMFLTRFGMNSRMVMCGDPKQVDLPGGVGASGLADAVGRLEGVEGIGTSRFTAPTWSATRSSGVSSRPMRGRMPEGRRDRRTPDPCSSLAQRRRCCISMRAVFRVAWGAL